MVVVGWPGSIQATNRGWRSGGAGWWCHGQGGGVRTCGAAERGGRKWWLWWFLEKSLRIKDGVFEAKERVIDDLVFCFVIEMVMNQALFIDEFG